MANKQHTTSGCYLAVSGRRRNVEQRTEIFGAKEWQRSKRHRMQVNESLPQRSRRSSNTLKARKWLMGGRGGGERVEGVWSGARYRALQSDRHSPLCWSPFKSRSRLRSEVIVANFSMATGMWQRRVKLVSWDANRATVCGTQCWWVKAFQSIHVDWKIDWDR